MSKSHKKLLDDNGKRTNITKEGRFGMSKSKIGNKNPQYITLLESEKEKLSTLYINNNYILKHNVYFEFPKYSKYVLMKTLIELKLWKNNQSKY